MHPPSHSPIQHRPPPLSAHHSLSNYHHSSHYDSVKVEDDHYVGFLFRHIVDTLLILPLSRTLATTIHITVTTHQLHFRRSSPPMSQIGIHMPLNVLRVTIVRIPLRLRSPLTQPSPRTYPLFVFVLLSRIAVLYVLVVELYTIDPPST